MKLTMEFERSDVRDMLEQYFERNGFRVRNLEELVDTFGAAFPDGIKVHVDALPMEDPPPAAPEPPERTYVQEVVRETPAEPPSTPAKGTPRLTASDLFDPEFQGIKSAPQDEDAMQKEIQHILRSSHEIERSRS